MINFELLKDVVLKNNSFLLTTHVNPDADAIGSEIAFYFILKQLGKKVYIINHSETPYNLTFLDEDGIIEQFDETKHKTLFDEVDVLAALDFNRSDRIIKMQSYFNQSKKYKICIDHHQAPEEFVDELFTDTNYAATGHIIYKFLEQTNIVKLNKHIAVPVYAAIMTDTGSFRYDRTTPDIHYITAKLLENGANPTDIANNIYDESKFGKIKLMGEALSSITLYGKEGKIAYMTIPKEAIEKTGALENDTDGFVNICLSIENVVMGLLFLELNDGFKVSFRSKGVIPVNKLAGEFGGGGHTNAAGARIKDRKMADLQPEILKNAEKYLITYGK
jgi:bifunctional oligoribonuclease and PAP phosphatase NrnA